MSTEKLEFKTELKQLLHLITHSLYSNREIFLRELISNASDAINRIRFDSLSHEDRLEGNKDWKIKLIADKAAGTLTISDNGIGMNRDTIVDHLGTIAKSGTRAFLDTLRQQQGQSAAGPDRPVRRRLLLGVHGRRPRDGRFAHGRFARAMASSGNRTARASSRSSRSTSRHAAPMSSFI